MKTKLITTIMLALFLGGILMAPVMAQPKKPLRCEVDIEVDWGPPVQWVGTITGDIEGTITVTEEPGAFLVGSWDTLNLVEHFYETWVIETVKVFGEDVKVELTGSDEGVWRWANWKWVANGQVEHAPEPLSYLVGCKMRYSGTTTPFLGFGEYLSGTGTLIIFGYGDE